MVKLKRIWVRQILIQCLLLVAPFAAYAASTISLVPAGDASFTLLASGLNAPAGFDISISFDSSRLSNPRLVQGALTSGAMLAVNTGLPGNLHFAVISSRPMPGSGAIATITFDRTGDSAGVIGVRGSVITLAGVNLPVTFSGWSAGGDPTGAGGSATAAAGGGVAGSATGSGSGSAAAGIPFVVGGTLTMPADDAVLRERKEAPAPPPSPQPQPSAKDAREAAVTAPGSSEAPEAPEAQPAGKTAPVELSRPIQSVLERFRLFTGAKTAQNLSALFDGGPDATFSQSPPICITDGKQSVRLTISKVSGDKAPNFTFSQARFVSLRHIGDGEWQIEALPDQGSDKASVAVLINGGHREIPLTVSRPANVDLDKSGTVDAADFEIFLQSAGTPSAAKYDLNRDGKRDYQDDYIFIANYLVARQGKNPKETPKDKSAK